MRNHNPSNNPSNKPGTFFQKGETFASSLLALTLDTYGTESLSWQPETLTMQIEGDFGIKMPEKNIDKLNAVITAITTDQFYRDPLIFGHICDALNDAPVDFQYVPCPQPEELAWGITEIAMLDGRQEFNSDVRRYIGVVLEEHGLYHPPDVLKLADYPTNSLEQAESNTADDPELYAAYYNRNKADAEDIVNYLKTRVVHLIKEMDELPLVHRDKETWGKFRDTCLKKFNSLKQIESNSDTKAYNGVSI